MRLILLSILFVFIQTVFGISLVYFSQNSLDKFHHAYGYGSIGEIVINKHIYEEKAKHFMRMRKKVIEQENRNKIYREHLASRISGSILKDFIPTRFR